MPSHPSARARDIEAVEPDEWNLLVRLPGRVVVAATLAVAGPPSRTVAEGIAGIDAVAAGRYSACDLVRAVVAAIYSASDQGPDLAPHAGMTLAEALADCRMAARVLARRFDRAQADGYRGWLLAVAARACQALLPGGLAERGAHDVPLAERAFLGQLDAALRPAAAAV
jgi:hypothetical protein